MWRCCSIGIPSRFWHLLSLRSCTLRHRALLHNVCTFALPCSVFSHDQICDSFSISAQLLPLPHISRIMLSLYGSLHFFLVTLFVSFINVVLYRYFPQIIHFTSSSWYPFQMPVIVNTDIAAHHFPYPWSLRLVILFLSLSLSSVPCHETLPPISGLAHLIGPMFFDFSLWPLSLFVVHLVVLLCLLLLLTLFVPFVRTISHLSCSLSAISS